MGNYRLLKFVFALVMGMYFLLSASGSEAKHEPTHGKGFLEKQKSGSAYMRHQRGYGSGQSDPVSHILKFSEELGLSKDQFSKIKAAQLDYKKKDIRLTADIKIARLDLRNQLHSGSFDENKFSVKSDELAKLTAQKIRLTTQTMIKVFKELTPEQIKKTQELHLMGEKGSRAKMPEGS